MADGVLADDGRRSAGYNLTIKSLGDNPSVVVIAQQLRQYYYPDLSADRVPAWRRPGRDEHFQYADRPGWSALSHFPGLHTPGDQPGGW